MSKRQLTSGESSAALRQRIEETVSDYSPGGTGSKFAIEAAALPPPVADTVGRTWVVLTEHCGSGMDIEYSLFSRKSDLDFFKDRKASGCAPSFDTYGYVPLLSLAEALYFLLPLLVPEKPKDESSPTWICSSCDTTYPKNTVKCEECELSRSDSEEQADHQEWYNAQVQGAFDTYVQWKEAASKADTAKIHLNTKEQMCEVEKFMLEYPSSASAATKLCFVVRRDDLYALENAVREAEAFSVTDVWEGPLLNDCIDGPYTAEDFVGEDNIKEIEETFELAELGCG